MGQNAKRLPGVKKSAKRYTRNVGLGFKPPRDVHSGYVDKKCPFTGDVAIRGRILTGVITKMKMLRTVIIRRITCTTSRSTTVLKSVTRTWLSTCRHASEMSSPEMLQLSVNADPSPKLSNSTH